MKKFEKQGLINQVRGIGKKYSLGLFKQGIALRNLSAIIELY
jgi:hypothetical protein